MSEFTKTPYWSNSKLSEINIIEVENKYDVLKVHSILKQVDDEIFSSEDTKNKFINNEIDVNGYLVKHGPNDWRYQRYYVGTPISISELEKIVNDIITLRSKIFEKQAQEMKENNRQQFTKDDLKSGMLIETNNGNIYCLINNTLVSQDGFMRINEYDDNLRNLENYDNYDIIRVSHQLEDGLLCPRQWTKNLLMNQLLWERKEECIVVDNKKITYDELLNKYGPEGLYEIAKDLKLIAENDVRDGSLEGLNESRNCSCKK